MYKAIREIGGYQIGEEVPTEKALVWLKMYSIPQVEEVLGKPKKVISKSLDKLADVYTPDDLFFKELSKIKGIGAKTAKDIVVWGTKEKLIEQIQLGAELPFRDDVVLKLKKKYGK